MPLIRQSSGLFRPPPNGVETSKPLIFAFGVENKEENKGSGIYFCAIDNGSISIQGFTNRWDHFGCELKRTE